MSAARMDPRIEARRDEVQRSISRRRVRAVLTVGSVVATVGLVWVILHSPLLDVDAVKVEPTPHVPAEAIRRASGVHTGDALAFVDAGSVAGRIRRLPWVDRVTVHRDWPGTVRIAITEHRPVLFVRNGTEAALVAADGRVFARVRGAIPGGRELRETGRLPEPGDRVVPGSVARLAIALPETLAGRARRFELREESLVLVLAGGGEVRFGPIEDLGAKAAAAAAVLAASPAVCIRYVDVSAPSTPVRREC